MDFSNLLSGIINFFQSLFGNSTANQTSPTSETPVPVTRKVLVIVYNPVIPSSNGRRLSEVQNWNSPGDLIAGYISDLKGSSVNYAGFEIVDQVEVDQFPVKEDGFTYNPDDYVTYMRTGSGFHQPDTADYHAILNQFDLVSKINTGAIDEVWLFGFPYSGFYESRMAGPSAFWCNAPPILDRPDCTRRFLIMGFNYERGVGEMLEAFAHRGEYIMQYVFRKKTGSDNLWQKFIRYDKTSPGKSEVGTVHYAPNSQFDYDWGNNRQVLSGCRNWMNFPDLSGAPVMVDCSEWGGGDIRQHHLWWLRHFPHISGSANGIAYNWWKYVVDPNNAE
jgi:hypothetical protein